MSYKGSAADIANRQRRNEQRREDELEIADKLPAVENTTRKNKAMKSLLYFLKTYFPDIFYLKFSPIHLEVIKRIEETIERGTCYALALPRGSGKTSICECALLWAMLSGKRRSVVLVAANQSRADAIKREITSLLTFSETLAADFPEACFPFAETARTPKKVKRLTYNGRPIRADSTKSFLVLPAIDGAPCFEATLYAVGLGGSVRGLAYTTISGEKVRPDLVLIDDPQTRESANSAEQCAERRRIIYADILGLAGAGKKTACLVTCTVIKQGDLADNLLDRATSPEFNGHRFSLLERFPDNVDLWGEWNKVRRLCLENKGNENDALEFYKLHREQMDAGAVHNWAQRVEPGDPSAIYSAMKLFYRDNESFYSEMQNKPAETAAVNEEYTLTQAQARAQISNVARGEIVDGDDFLTAFVDVHKNLLYWTLCAWNKSDGSGRVVDFGTYPPQPETFFNLDSARYTIPRAFPNMDYYDALTISLKSLFLDLTQRDYITSGLKTKIQLERVLIDANWNESTDAIYNFIRLERSSILYPAHGKYYGVKSEQRIENKRDCFALGAGFFVPRSASRQGVRRVIIDSNYMKTELMRRLRAEHGTPCKISLSGNVNELGNLINHLNAEYGEVVESRGRRCVEWSQKPGIDNHWFDCLVGSLTAAEMLGLSDKELKRRRDHVRAFMKKIKQQGM